VRCCVLVLLVVRGVVVLCRFSVFGNLVRYGLCFCAVSCGESVYLVDKMLNTVDTRLIY